MKKYLPLILLGAGLIVVIVVVLVIVKNLKSGDSSMEDESSVPEISQDQWPAVSLIPTSDAHWLKLKVDRLKVEGAESMDYELVYTLPDGRSQGVPGTVSLSGIDSIEKDLLLGSESSGKFRYDEGVEKGTITLRFRNSKGKLLGKLSTEFHMQSGVTELTSTDGAFTYTLEEKTKGVVYVTLKTFAQPDSSLYLTWSDGYGVFASDN